MGRIRRAHGIHGELAVEPLADDPPAVYTSGRRLFAGTADGELWHDPETGETRSLTVVSSRPFKDGLLVTLKEIADRTEADRWRGRHLLLPVEELEAPTEGEAYVHELEGMRVLDTSGAELGVVSAWYQLPNGILMDVTTPRGVRALPFNDAFVRELRRAERLLVVDVPAGLLD